MKWPSKRAWAYDYATGCMYVTYVFLTIGVVWLLLVLASPPIDVGVVNFLAVWLLGVVGFHLLFRGVRWLTRPRS